MNIDSYKSAKHNARILNAEFFSSESIITRVES